MYVCDTGPFFQSSFLDVINPKNWAEPLVSQAEFDTIERGKAKRDSAVLDQDMRRYMGLEIEVLSRVMSQLNSGFVKAGIKLKKDQWFGPGQAAQAWLKNVGGKDLTGTRLRERIPSYALEAAQASYYGGWFELMIHGYVEGILYGYDINSAYPAVIAKLPCLQHGVWSRCTRTSGKRIHQPPETGFTLVHASVHGEDQHIGAMLHRDRHGNILRPSNTAGWYWLHELRAAERAGLIHWINIDEWIHYDPCSCPPPLRGIRGLYDNRLQIGKNTASGKAYKIVYNSAYGKFAQSVGSPMFGNPVYASLITAGCRTQILDAIGTHPEGSKAVAMVATDGVYFTSPHPRLPLSDALGDWDLTEHENMTLFKPGVYWDDKAREALRRELPAKFKARGVNSRAFSARLLDIDTQFKAWAGRVPAILPNEPGRPDWPKVSFPVPFSMVTVTQALQWDRWFQAGHVMHDKILKQDSDPVLKRDINRREAWDGKYFRSRPWWHGIDDTEVGRIESYPYDKRFGRPGGIVDGDPIADSVNQDGPVVAAILTGLGKGA